MHWLGRYILNGMAALALLVGVASAVMWVRSYSVADLLVHERHLVWHDAEGNKRGWERSRFLGANQGELYLAQRVFGPYTFLDGAEESGGYSEHVADDPHVPWNLLGYDDGESIMGAPSWMWAGFAYTDCDVAMGRYEEVRIPLYALTLLLLGWPAIRLGKRVKRVKSARAGHCAACGYDLRATPEAGGALLGRCPECGRDAG